MSFVVTGTDTGIGKTVFSAALAHALGLPYWKPIQAGTEDGTDSDTVRRLAGVEILPEAYVFQRPASPHLAAEVEGRSIDPDRLVPPQAPAVIEGAGGLMVPLTHEMLFIDVFARWKLPVILVARTSLGTINHSLLSIAALRARDIPLHGVAFVGPYNEDSESIICEMGAARRLGRLGIVDPLETETLAAAFRDGFDSEAFR